VSAIPRNVAVLFTILLVSGASVLAADGNSQMREISDGVYSFTLGEGNHSMFVVGEDGVAVFDTFNSRHSEAMLTAIRGVTELPVKYAFHSHNHWDHASGGKVFKDAGAETVMHALAAEWLTANPGRDTVSADIVWSGQRRDIDLGDFTVQMHYLGMNHGLGMTLFTIPERRAAFIADLVSPNRVMFAVVPDFNIGEWERSLGEILEMDFDIAVCSHNELPMEEAMAGCTRTHVEEERQFIRDLRNAILAEFEKGTGFMEIPKAVRLPQYSHWVGYEEWLEMNTLRLMTDLWMGPFPWIPDAR
jgi:glyoxylase-like metal-dependent hydrolase (beta-lactamase superfamily II)